MRARRCRLRQIVEHSVHLKMKENIVMIKEVL